MSERSELTPCNNYNNNNTTLYTSLSCSIMATIFREPHLLQYLPGSLVIAHAQTRHYIIIHIDLPLECASFTIIHSLDRERPVE